MQSPHLLWQCPGWPGMHYDAATIGEALRPEVTDIAVIPGVDGEQPNVRITMTLR